MNRLINNPNHRQLFDCFHRNSTIYRHSSIRNSVKQRPHLSHPSFWYDDYPISLIGTRQSPISIKKDDCILNSKRLELPPLKIKYPQFFTGLKLRNPKDDTYFGWRVDIPYDLADHAVISGGPLNHRYKLVQFHAHWGKECHCGSEHIVDGKSYAAELHFVHWNFDLYSSARKAAIAKDGLTVVAVFLEVIDDHKFGSTNFKPLNSLESISKSIPQIKYKGQIKEIKQMDILEMFPKNRSYYTYLGSLTTPPLWESVTWIIFEEPIYCTEKQLNSFRQLSYYKKERIDEDYIDEIYDTNVDENVRPVQPLNGRQIIYVKKN